MNKRNLALLISKHPLLRKLTEDKTIPKSIVARLIVEELLEASKSEFYTGVQGELGYNAKRILNKNFNIAKKSGNAEDLQKFIETYSDGKNPYGKFDQIPNEIQQVLKKYGSFLITKAAEQIKILQSAEPAKNTPDQEDDDKVKQAQQKLDKEVAAADQKVDQALKNSTEQSTQVDTKNLIPAIADVIIDMGKKDQFVTTYDQNAPTAVDFVINKLPAEQVDVLKTAPPETQQKVVKAVADELEKDQQENPFKDLEGYSELNLKPPEEKVFVQFLTKLQQAKIINEENLVQLSKIIGTGRGLNKIIKGFEPPERKLLIVVLQRTEVQKFIQNNVQQIEKPQEPGKEEKPSTPMKGKPVAIKPEQAQKFVGAANNLINDFYNKKYRKEQADLVGEVITAMKEFVEDQDLALAFGKPPADKPTPEKAPEEQEATPEKAPEEQEATPEEQATEPLKEQEDEKVDADKNEMRSIRISLRSFLTRVNKTKKFLSEFEEVAGAGSVLSDSYKKRFMDNLQKIQSSIKKIANVLVKIIGSKEKINEREESDVMKKWKQVQKAYDEALKATSSVKELLDTSTPPDELDSFLTNDAYSALIDLAGHFPSVAPFGAGKMKRSDFEEYKIKFDTAIGQVKSDLQNVFNLMKTGEAASSALNDARDGLRDFADAIASIFGVPSQFEDAKVKPGDDEQPAVQEDPEDMGGFPRDLPTQIKDTLDEYYGTYIRLKEILDKGLFKESINDDYQAVKGALANSKKTIKTIVTGDNYKDLIAAGEKDGVSREETVSMVGDMMRYFVRVYEELMKLYKKATEEPEKAKKPSWWKNLWPKTLEQFSKLKDTMKDLFSKFEDWLVGTGLDIDLDLKPGDIPGTERPEVSVEEDYTEEIASAEDGFKKILSREKFLELTGNSKYYGVFMKLVLVIYSQSPLNEEVRIGSINAPLVRAAPSGMFKQDILQGKLKRLAKNNQGLVREISEMMAAIPTSKMKLILDVVSQNKNEIKSLDFEAILSKDFAKKEKTSIKQVKDSANLRALFTEKSSDFTKMVGLLKKHTRQPIQLRNALIVWYLMLNTTGTEEIKENNKKENNPGIFSKIPQKYRKEKSLNPAKIVKVKRLLKKFNPILSKAISALHNKVEETDLLRMYLILDKIFKDTKISLKMDKMSISKVVNALSDKDAEEDTSGDVVDDSLLDKEDELEEKIARKIKPLIQEMLTKGK